jgi:hypothetical protein
LSKTFPILGNSPARQSKAEPTWFEKTFPNVSSGIARIKREGKEEVSQLGKTLDHSTGRGDEKTAPTRDEKPGLDAKDQSREAITQRAREVAGKVGAKLGIEPKLIFEQWAHETGGFASNVMKKFNNFGGIRLPGKTEYQKFDSLEAYGDRYAQLMSSKRYQKAGIGSAKTTEDFAAALKKGSYYEDNQANYTRGMNSFGKLYDKGSSSAPKVDTAAAGLNPATPKVVNAMKNGATVGGAVNTLGSAPISAANIAKSLGSHPIAAADSGEGGLTGMGHRMSAWVEGNFPGISTKVREGAAELMGNGPATDPALSKYSGGGSTPPGVQLKQASETNNSMKVLAATAAPPKVGPVPQVAGKTTNNHNSSVFSDIKAKNNEDTYTRTMNITFVPS